MLSSALKAHLHTSRKIVNDSHTFLLGDLPDLSCDCCLQFTYHLRIVLIHIVLEIPPQIKNMWGPSLVNALPTQDSKIQDSKKLYCPFKNIKNGNCSSVTHKMTVIKTLVNHIRPTVVNTHTYTMIVSIVITKIGKV